MNNALEQKEDNSYGNGNDDYNDDHIDNDDDDDDGDDKMLSTKSLHCNQNRTLLWSIADKQI